MLRNAYRAWWMKKRAEEILLIGLERGLAGLPMARIPAESIIGNDAAYQRYATMIRRLRQDEQMGVVTASDLWPGTNMPMYEVTTLPSAGAPGVDPVEVVRMFANDIAASVLASFIYLGRDAVGSRALATPMQEIFQRALETWLDSMEDSFHHQAVLPLLKLNGFQIESPPRWRHGTVQDVDLGELGQCIQQVSASGYDWGIMNANDPIRDQLRTMAGFDPEPEEFEEREGPKPNPIPPALAAYTGQPEEKPKPQVKRWDGGKGLWIPR